MEIRICLDPACPEPIFRQMADQIAHHISRHRLAPGARLPKLQTLAASAGVSLRTADRAVNELIRRGLCSRRPKKATLVGEGRRLVQRKRLCGIYHARGITSPEFDVIQAAIYRGIRAGAQEQNLDMFFITADAEATIDFYRTQNTLEMTGVIMLYWSVLDRARELAARFPDLRFVYVNHEPPGFDETPANIVGSFNDEFAGAYQMTNYLLDKGYKRIAVFSPIISILNYQRRVEGYRQALKAAGIDLNAKYTYVAPCANQQSLPDFGRVITRRCLRQTPDVEAIFCVNDLMASGIVNELRANGPARKIEVTGYDNLWPALSRELKFATVSIDFETMGRRALQMIEGNGNSPKIVRTVPQVVIH